MKNENKNIKKNINHKDSCNLLEPKNLGMRIQNTNRPLLCTNEFLNISFKSIKGLDIRRVLSALLKTAKCEFACEAQWWKYFQTL